MTARQEGEPEMKKTTREEWNAKEFRGKKYKITERERG